MYSNNIKTKMKLKTLYLSVFIQTTLMSTAVGSRKYETNCYTQTRLKAIPQDHLYHKLVQPDRPIVIGHRGNIQRHQENTLEGMRNLIAIKAGGMHMQVRTTKDNKLILFGDDSLKRLAGENYDVRRLPYSEIVKMRLLSTVKYRVSDTKTESMSYSSRPRIPLLEDVLKAVKGSDLLVYIELVPSTVPPSGPLDRHRGQVTSRLTAELIRKLGMENQIVVVSRDAFKLKALDHFAPDVVTGWWMDKGLFTQEKGDAMRKVYQEIPDIYFSDCFANKPNGTRFTEYLLKSGIVSKAVNASILDVALDIHDAKKTSLKRTLADSYGAGTSLGAFDVTTWGMTEKEKRGSDAGFIQNAVENGVTRFITDDVNRVKRALHEETTGAGRQLYGNYYGVFAVFTVLLGKAIVTLVYV